MSVKIADNSAENPDLVVEDYFDSIFDLEIEDDSPSDPLAISVVDLDDDEEDEEKREKDWENDRDHSKFIAYIRNRLANIPKHSGKTTVGCERTISALRQMNKEISQAIAGDMKCEIDEHEAEELRDTIYSYIDKLENALDKLVGKKRRKDATIKIDKKVFVRLGELGEPAYYVSVSDHSGQTLLPVELLEPTPEQVQSFAAYENGLHKQASAPIHLVADPFQNEITKILIESHVTFGRNINDVYSHLSEKYAFNDRDHLAIQGLLREKGFPVIKDMSRLGDEIGIGEGGANSTKIYPA